jgi:hypothetical protein
MSCTADKVGGVEGRLVRRTLRYCRPSFRALGEAWRLEGRRLGLLSLLCITEERKVVELDLALRRC